jgi:hypothetical protein
MRTTFLVLGVFVLVAPSALAQQENDACNTAQLPRIVNPARENQPPCFNGPDYVPGQPNQPMSTGGLSRCKTICVTIPSTAQYKSSRSWVDQTPNGWWNPGLNEPNRGYNGPNQQFCMPILSWSHDQDRTAHFCVKYTF